MEKIKVSEIRAKFPMYSDLSDDQLLSGIRQKFYADIPMPKFAALIDYDTQREGLQKEITDEAGAVGNFRAGMGKAFADTARGVGQLVGLGPDRAEVDEIKRRDAGLTNTTAGAVGNFVGQVAPAVATVAIPVAAGLRGAAAIGAGMGAAQPVGTTDSRIQNTAIGGAAGAGGVAAGRLLGGVASGAKALIDPFTQKGREKIAGRTILRFADDPMAVRRATGARTPTGAVPTLAEETGDAGLSRLQDAVRSLDPQIENRVGQRLRDNNAERVGTLQGLAGNSATRQAAVDAREATAGLAYRKAFVRDALKLNPRGEKEVAALLEMPAIQAAMKQAQAIAKNKGVDIADPAGSAQGLHYIKLALDDAYSAAGGGGGTAAQKNAADGIKAAQKRLVNFLEDLRPDYKTARTEYARMSKPINAQDILEEVAKRGTSNLSDLSGNPRLQANALAGAMRDEPALIKRATGRAGINALSEVLEPNQLNMLRTVAAEADRTAAVASAGAGPGSPTAQRLASQNVLERLIGPTGLPTSWAESALANTVVGKPLNLIYGNVAEAKIQQALADAVLDPAKARQFLAAAQKQGLKLPDNAATRALMQIARTSAPAALVSQPEGR